MTLMLSMTRKVGSELNKRRLLVAVVAVAAAIGIGTGVVLAAGGDDDRPLQGADRDRATQAALDHVGGGTVIETEVGDDGAAYGVEIEKADGSVVEVNLDEDFQVIGTEPDDDTEGEDDGPEDD